VYASVRSGAETPLVCSRDDGATWALVLYLRQPSANGLALPDGDLMLAEASEAGGMHRLPMGTAVAAGAWSQSDEPDLGRLASISTDCGTTWTTVPVPGA
jgi:hypothetical protein